MDGGILVGVGILVSLNSLLQVAAVVKTYGLQKTQEQFTKNVDKLIGIHEKRIVRLEDKQMEKE